MPQAGQIYRALIASPSDCQGERAAIPEVLQDWNAAHSLTSRACILPMRWELDAYPALGDRPQALLNKQLVSQCDLLIGTFWTRIGSPTGVARSGTAEEIAEFRDAGKPILLYFSSAPIEPHRARAAGTLLHLFLDRAASNPTRSASRTATHRMGSRSNGANQRFRR
jgi:hypothetical protein